MGRTHIKRRDQINESDTWDLTQLFPLEKNWENLYKAIEERIPEYDKFKDRLNTSFDTFKSCIEFDHGLFRDLEKIFTYAHLKNDEDKTDSRYDAMFQRASNLYSRVMDRASFIVPEIQAIPEKTLADWAGEPDLFEYRFYLEKIIRKIPHTRNTEVEQVLAMAGESLTAPRQIFGQLDNADLEFGTLTDEKGEEKPLTHGNFITFLNSGNRPLRKKAYTQYYGAYNSHKHTIAASLAASVKKDNFMAKARKFDNARQAALFKDNVEDRVYDNLISSVKKNLEPLYSYLNLRKERLNLSELKIFDTYVPLVPDMDFHMGYDEAVTTCIAALAPLGREYCQILEKGLLHGWVDRYENRGKRSGAYSSGCFDSPPYILMNYDPNTINSLFTLIHEAGHSMHSHYSRKHQPYASHDYTIFVAEVASTLNETLLTRFLREKYKDDRKMTAFLVNREIDNIRATFFRQTMFAEFENRIHNLAANNQALTLEVLTKEYKRLLALYFGPAMAIDDTLPLECLRIPHFYSAFYVYQYATGLAAALGIAQRIEVKGREAVDDYLSFLKLGGSMFPLDELKVAGVDMASPEPVDNTIAYFSKLVDRLREL